jgi:hypothetical protein
VCRVSKNRKNSVTEATVATMKAVANVAALPSS